ncbi:Mu-like prophage major head subunit gpT [Polystyrenella longa]|uniref:Mu-like prophage major head subunit gpT n=1 Tax=Polystyrenella longa TaxID=2528007 RepID=A0A518CPN2_9PLAN|nr:Mu-like prophage major head subunit gpT family protein [Polystyrenella longa]QDU81178.1 Mu-like prophage major head subunit gpT [Polystyrenella longa]
MVTMPEQQMMITAATETVLEAKQNGDVKIDLLAYTGGFLRVAGWETPVIIDLNGLTISDQIPFLVDHENTLSSTVGYGHAIVRDFQVWATGILSSASAKASEVIGLHKSGVQFQCSVGTVVQEIERVPVNQTIYVNGKAIKADHPFMVARKSKLNEISIVTIGADPETLVRIAANFHSGEIYMSGKSTTTESGDTTNQTQEKNVTAPVTTLNASGNNITEADERTVENERARIAGVIEACNGEYPKIQAKAIGEGWDVQKTELEVLRAGRPTAPAGVGGGSSNHTTQGQILEAALCFSCGLTEEQAGQHYDERTIEAALSSKYQNVGLHDVLISVLNAAGRHNPSGNRITVDTIKAAFSANQSLQANFSTVSLPGIVSNVANKSMLSAYNAVNTTWQHFCRVESNSDFKQHTRYRLTGKGEFSQIAPSGELKHVSLQEQEYTSKLETSGAIISITREMMINDDLSALSQLPAIMGRMAAIKLEKEVYTLLLSNPSNFFAAGNNNYFDGADSVLSIDSLTEADQYFTDQVDENGDPILINPEILLVPSTLKTTARQIVRDTTVEINPTANTPTPSGNPHAGAYKAVATPWLNSQNLSGASASAWYLLTNGNDVAVMEVAFLGGRKSPFIETADTSFDTLGMQMRSYFDFGVAMGDPRGGVKSKGAAA